MNFDQHLARYKVLIEKQEARSKFVRYADTNKDVELLKEVLKQDPQALRKMSPAGIVWGEVVDKLGRPKNQLYRDWTNRILPTLRRHLAGKTVTAFSEPLHTTFQAPYNMMLEGN